MTLTATSAPVQMQAFPSIEAWIAQSNDFIQAVGKAGEIALKMRTSPAHEHLNRSHGFLVLLHFLPAAKKTKQYMLKSVELVTVEEGAALLGLVSSDPNKAWDITTSTWISTGFTPPSFKPIQIFFVARHLQDETAMPLTELFSPGLPVPSDQRFKGVDESHWKEDFIHCINEGSISRNSCPVDHPMGLFFLNHVENPLLKAVKAALTAVDTSGRLNLPTASTHAIFITLRNASTFLDELPSESFHITSIDLITHEEGIHLLSKVLVEATTNFAPEIYYDSLRRSVPRNTILFKVVVLEEGGNYYHGFSKTLQLTHKEGHKEGESSRNEKKTENWQEDFMKIMNGDLEVKHDTNFIDQAKQKAATPLFTCFFCFKRLPKNDMTPCGDCKVQYCSAECKKKDWDTTHSQGCQRMAEARKVRQLSDMGKSEAQKIESY